MKHQLTDADINYLMNLLQADIENTLQEMRESLPQDPIEPEGVIGSKELADLIQEWKKRVLNVIKHCQGEARSGRLRREMSKFIADLERNIRIKGISLEYLEKAYKANGN